jgi:hypothetical protein
MEDVMKEISGELDQLFRGAPWFQAIGVAERPDKTMLYVYCIKKPPKNVVIKEYKGYEVEFVVHGPVVVDTTDKFWKKKGS